MSKMEYLFCTNNIVLKVKYVLKNIHKNGVWRGIFDGVAIPKQSQTHAYEEHARYGNQY